MRLRVTIGGISQVAEVLPSLAPLTGISLDSETIGGTTFYYKRRLVTRTIPDTYINPTGQAGKSILTSWQDGGNQITNSTLKIGRFSIKNFYWKRTSGSTSVSGYANLDNSGLDNLNDVYGQFAYASANNPYTMLIASLSINGIDGYLLTGFLSSDTGIDWRQPDRDYIWGLFWFSANMADDAIVENYDYGNETGDADGTGGVGNGVPLGQNVGFTRITAGLANLASGLNAYRVVNADLVALSNYLWGRSGGGFDAGGIWEKFKNYKFNPIAGIVSHHVIPASLWTGVSVGTSTGISIAGMTMDGVQNPAISGQPITGNHFGYYETGAVEIPLPYASFADYSNTRVSLYLPFCGNVNIDPSYCVGGTVNVLYQCDVLNGNIAAQVLTTDRRGCSRIAAVASGNCAYNVPYTGNDNGAGEIIGALKGVATGAMTGGVGSIIGGAATLGFGLEKHTTTIQGSIAGNAGWLSSMSIVLTVDWGHLFNTDGYYAEMNGRPSEMSGSVSTFTGHSQLIVHADAISEATEEEKREIENLCRNGVVV